VALSHKAVPPRRSRPGEPAADEQDRALPGPDRALPGSRGVSRLVALSHKAVPPRRSRPGNRRPTSRMGRCPGPDRALPGSGAARPARGSAALWLWATRPSRRGVLGRENRRPTSRIGRCPNRIGRCPDRALPGPGAARPARGSAALWLWATRPSRGGVGGSPASGHARAGSGLPA